MINRLAIGGKELVLSNERKKLATLAAFGYSQQEMQGTIRVMLAMTLDELKEVYEDPNTPAFEKTIAIVIRKSIEKGSLFNMELLLSRAFGKPRESVEVIQEVQKRAFNWHSNIEDVSSISETITINEIN